MASFPDNIKEWVPKVDNVDDMFAGDLNGAYEEIIAVENYLDVRNYPRASRFVVGSSLSGITAKDCDYLCDGTDDQVEINAAIQALPATGGEVVILDGVYNITQKISVNKANTTLSGNGSATVLKRMWSSVAPEGVINVEGSGSNCIIKNLCIDGNKASYTGMNFGIYISTNNNKIIGNTINSSMNTGIMAGGNTQTIIGNICSNNKDGISISYGQNITIKGNTCSNNLTSSILLANTTNSVVAGNVCNGNSARGIQLSYSNNNSITSNSSNNNSFGIDVYNSNNNVFTGNVCNNNSSTGIFFSASINNTVTGNTCVRGTGLTTDYSSEQDTMRLYQTANNYNNVSDNNCIGKAPTIEGGTGNTLFNNKWNAGDDVGVLSSLTTTEKSNLVGAINEVDADLQLHKTDTATELAKKAATTYVDNINNDLEYDIGVLSGSISLVRSDLVGGINAVDADLQSHKEENATQLQDIRNALALALAHYDPDKGEYVNLDQYWNSLRNGKIYTVEFNQFSVSPSPLGTKKDDNAGLVMEPSTNILAGRDDYNNIGLFKAIDVNGYVDENDDYHVTAIKGDSRFAKDGTNGDVWVMAMPGYLKWHEDEITWGISYSDAMHPAFELLDEAEKPNGEIRPFLLHAKHAAGRNPHENNNLASISGVSPEFNNMSHNGQITEFKAKGVQYSGKTSHDDFYVQLMMWLKYATMCSDSVMKGCQSYYLQYTNLVAEIGVKRVIITNLQANELLVGSTVSIGDYGIGSINTDRQSAQNYNKANRVNITEIVDLGDGNSAVYVDSTVLFDTTLATTITTYPWNSGGCDNVLGVDGSPYNNLSGKEPFIINGIEMMVGGYEVLQNLIISNNAVDNRIDVYVNYDCKTYATSITSAYDLVGQLAITNNAWQYGSKMVMTNNHPTVILITETNASSTTGTGDAIYTNPPSVGGTRVAIPRRSERWGVLRFSFLACG